MTDVLSRGGVVYHRVGMAATVTFEVAVVRAAARHKCATCGNRRVCYAIVLTLDIPIGNPQTEWRCATDWGLRR